MIHLSGKTILSQEKWTHVDNSPDKHTAQNPVPARFRYTVIFLLLFIAGAGFSLYCSFQGWDGSLIEMFSFRQTQTAITVQYFLKGGPLLNYETPVLGPPWSIPLEFPFYQYIVFAITKLSGYPLDPAGRLVSLLFFLSALYPFYHLIKDFFTDRFAVFIALLLLCISPQYLFWSRSFMIESTALALSLWYLYFFKKESDREERGTGSVLLLSLILVAGAVAAITKVTTFFIYYLIGALFLSVRIIRLGRSEKLSSVLRKNLVLLVVGLVVPLATIVIWSHYTDQIKALNPIGAKLTTAALKKWTFGTLEQKLTYGFWKKTVIRSLTDLTGNVWLFLVTFAFLPFCRKRTVGTVLLLIFLFFVPIAVFFNLYFVHNYYVYANGILLLLALALVIGDLSARSLPWLVLSLVLLLAICVSSGKYYLEAYYPMQGNEYRFQDMKYQVDKLTGADDILVFIGADWSPEMPYYFDRRALMLPDSLTDEENYRKAVENLKPYRVGGIFFCFNYRNMNNKYEILGNFSKFFPAGFKPVPFRNCDAYFAQKGIDP